MNKIPEKEISIVCKGDKLNGQYFGTSDGLKRNQKEG